MYIGFVFQTFSPAFFSYFLNTHIFHSRWMPEEIGPASDFAGTLHKIRFLRIGALRQDRTNIAIILLYLAKSSITDAISLALDYPKFLCPKPQHST